MMGPAIPPERAALGYPNRLDGLDCSEFQPNIHYPTVAAAGFRFAIVRVALGSGYTDRRAAEHTAGFRDAGMYVLPYAAARPADRDPRPQANRLYDAMGDVYPGRLVLDLETRGNLTNAELVDFAEAFAEECETFGVLEPVLYSYPYYLKELGEELVGSRLARMPLWLASFPYEPWVPPPTFAPVPPPPWTRVALHQYGADDGFRVPGVGGACDRDLFMGDEDALRAWLGLPGPTQGAA